MSFERALLALWLPAAALGVFTVTSGCKQRLDVGRWRCGAQYGDAGNGADQFAVVGTDVEVPWASGFEDGFCGFREVGGFCYANLEAQFDLVEEPVRTGRFASAFQVAGSADWNGLQARCVRQGRLPQDAYYGAWFYISGPISQATNWNLFHFEGPVDAGQNGQWDVSLQGTGGRLELYAFDFLRMNTLVPESRPVVPVRQWFHLQVHLRRASDETGEFGLYLNGANVLQLEDVNTVNTDVTQWYVGSLAETLVPSETVLYVDDVSITATPEATN